MWASAVLLLATVAAPGAPGLRAPWGVQPPEQMLRDHAAVGQARWLLTVAARGPAPQLALGLSHSVVWRPEAVVAAEVRWLAWPAAGRRAVVSPEATLRLVTRHHAFALGQVDHAAPNWAGRRLDGWRLGGGVARGLAGWWQLPAAPARLVAHVALGRGSAAHPRSLNPAALPPNGPGPSVFGPGPTQRWLVEGSLSGLWRRPSGTQLWLLAQGQRGPPPPSRLMLGQNERRPAAANRASVRDFNARRGPAPWRLTSGIMQPAFGGHLHLWGAARPHGQRLGARYGRSSTALQISYRRDGSRRHSLALTHSLQRGAGRAGWGATWRPELFGPARPRRLAGYVALPLGRPSRQLRYDVSLSSPSSPGVARAAPPSGGMVPRMALSLRMRPAVASRGLAWQGAVGWLGSDHAAFARGQAAVRLGPALVRARLQLHTTHYFGGIEAFFCL